VALDKLNHNYEDPLIVSNLLVTGESNGGGGGGGSATIVSDTAPTDPAPQNGDGWFDSSTGLLYVYYTDADSGQWVQTSSGLSGGADIRGRVGSLETRTTAVEGVNATQNSRLTAVEGYAQQSSNFLINGAFDIWQRGTTFASPASGSYSADRWQARFDGSGATRTISRQVFTLGSAPVAGYEGDYFYRYAQTVAGTGATFSNVLEQRIENVRTLAGQTITVSFWAKADAARTLTPVLGQSFGTGGSPSATVFTAMTSQSITTSWARYSATLTVPSIAGKTIGTNSNDYLAVTLQSATINATQTIDIWGVQVEAGSVATPFRRNAPSIQAELAACQRYYQQFDLSGQFNAAGANGLVATKWNASDAIFANLYLATQMRVAPVMTRSITTARYVNSGSGSTPTVTFSSFTSNPTMVSFAYTNNAVAAGAGWLDTMGVHYANAEL
jgi:hypothetical protein